MGSQPKRDKNSLLAKTLSGLDMKGKHGTYLVQLKRIVSRLQKGISLGGCQGKACMSASKSPSKAKLVRQLTQTSPKPERIEMSKSVPCITV